MVGSISVHCAFEGYTTCVLAVDPLRWSETMTVALSLTNPCPALQFSFDEVHIRMCWPKFQILSASNQRYLLTCLDFPATLLGPPLPFFMPRGYLVSFSMKAPSRQPGSPQEKLSLPLAPTWAKDRVAGQPSNE